MAWDAKFTSMEEQPRSFNGTLVIVLVTLAAAGLALTGPALMGRPVENLSREQIVATLGMPLPPGAANLHSLRYGFQERVLFLRFDMPPEELPDWLAKTPFEELSSEVIPDGLSVTLERPWWRPSGAREFLAGQVQEEGTRSMLIDVGSVDRYTVFLFSSNL